GPGFFRVLGAPALLGRTLEPADFIAADQAVVISHALWRQRFAAAPNIIGSRIEINGAGGEVVGVMPPEFAFPTPEVQVWQPISVLPQWKALQGNPRSRDADALMVIGRLTPTATFDAARAELDTIAARLRAAYSDTNARSGIVIEPLTDHVLGPRTGRALWLLFVAVGFVLLIACSNVAHLALARGVARRHELSIRTALGASKRRLVRQALTENLVLAVLAAGVGVLLAWLATAALRAWAASALPRLETVGLDVNVLLFALLLSLICGLVAGLLPALRSSRANPVQALWEGGARSLGGAGSRRLRHGLVIAELALAVVLLSGAGLLIHSFVRLYALNRGFDSRHVLLLQVDLPERYDGQARKAEYYRTAFERIRALPGVVAAGAIGDLFIERTSDLQVTLEGQPKRGPDDPTPPLIRDRVVPGYFEAMRIPLRQGRYLRDADLVEDLDNDHPRAVVINETMARAFWPGQDAVGKRVKVGRDPQSDAPWITVVGVVADAKRDKLDEATTPSMFWPGFGPQMDIVVRTAGAPEAVQDAVRAELRALEPTAPPYGVVAVEQRLWETVALRTLQTMLLAALAAAALILAVIGVYGVIHQSVVARTQEIGVRMALGASKASVLRMILSGALGLSVTGLTVGMIGALALAQTLSSFLYETSPLDPLIYLAVALLLVVVTMAACLAPASRAARVDPMTALRYE
ncbi:MAG: ABC transporter permease, partial [Vicinamibacteraceae bacterium]